jgi:hypothetical protein
MFVSRLLCPNVPVNERRFAAALVQHLNHRGYSVMVSRCFNPDCPESFRYLEKGSLFRLEPDAATNAPVIEAEYF